MLLFNCDHRRETNIFDDSGDVPLRIYQKITRMSSDRCFLSIKVFLRLLKVSTSTRKIEVRYNYHSKAVTPYRILITSSPFANTETETIMRPTARKERKKGYRCNIGRWPIIIFALTDGDAAAAATRPVGVSKVFITAL